MNQVGSFGSSLSVDISKMVASGDIQTLIQMVQGERVRLLDTQLVDQVKAVQDRNDKIAALNEVLSGLNAYAGQIDGTSATSKPGSWPADSIANIERPLNSQIQQLGIDLNLSSRSGLANPLPGKQPDPGRSGTVVTGTNVINGSTTKGEIDAAITKVKGLIDAESNNQQMDMLRLQSLNNKKNESIEILTNTQKKSSDSNSGIIRNF